MSSRELCRRSWLNQPRYSTIANSSWLAAAPDAVGDQLGLEGVHERFGQGVIAARRRRSRSTAARRDRREPGCGRGWCIDCRRRCGPRARRRRRAAVGERHPQRVDDERVAHVRGELPADHAPAVDVDDEREVQDAVPAAQPREVADPQPIGRLGAEVALDEIRRPGRVGVRRPWCATACRGAWRPGCPRWRISRWTWQRGTCSPARRSAFHVRR